MPEIPVSRSGKAALDIAVEAARDAGAILLDHFTRPKTITEKGRGNIVTDVDHEVERFVIGRLTKEYPNLGILAEESGQGGAESEYAWIIDPLDGTRNYASGVPHFAVTLALARGKDVLVGVTFDPSRGELFQAEKGRGAFLNGSRMTISSQSGLRGCLLGTDMGYSDGMGHHVLELLGALWPDMQGFRVMGSAALGLAYAAVGRLDIYFHHLLSPWDIAAGVLFAEEAGGVVTNSAGLPLDFRKDRSIVVAGPAVHALFLNRAAGSTWQNATP